MIKTEKNTMVLDPEEIKVGMMVAIYEGAVGNLEQVKRCTFEVAAIQLPFVAVCWPESKMDWLIDTRETTLVELTPEMAKALKR